MQVVSFAVPALAPRQAEALIDLLEQLQGVLWDAYGDAIAELATKDPEPAPQQLDLPQDTDDSTGF
jgi:hypothetical protein